MTSHPVKQGEQVTGWLAFNQLPRFASGTAVSPYLRERAGVPA